MTDVRSSARVLWKAGKNRDEYQTADDIIAQATRAMDILEKDYPDETHVFAYDNATIHTCRPVNALSARKMTLHPNTNFGGEVKVNGKVVRKVKMRDTVFSDGTIQELYHPANHPTHPGWFKGLRKLIQERCERRQSPRSQQNEIRM